MSGANGVVYTAGRRLIGQVGRRSTSEGAQRGDWPRNRRPGESNKRIPKRALPDLQGRLGVGEALTPADGGRRGRQHSTVQQLGLRRRDEVVAVVVSRS